MNDFTDFLMDKIRVSGQNEEFLLELTNIVKNNCWF